MKPKDKAEKEDGLISISGSQKPTIFKKVIAILVMMLAIFAMLGLAFSKITAIEFWLATLFCAAFTWIALPRIR